MRASVTLKVGDPAPEFSLSAANRPGTLSLHDLIQRGPVVLEFLRGTWWPNCVKRMARFGSQVQSFIQAGAQVAFIAAEKRAGMFKPEKFLAKHPVPFPFLLDEDRSVTKAYGVYQRLGFDGMDIAHPATFVVDARGAVRWMYVGSTQLDRAPLEEVLQQVRAASAQKV